MKTKDFIKDDITAEDHLDHEVRMAKSDLMQLAKDSLQLIKLLNQFASEERGIPGWVASKITKAQDYISSANKSLSYDAAEDGQIHETASAGATASGSIATAIGAGNGFANGGPGTIKRVTKKKKKNG